VNPLWSTAARNWVRGLDVQPGAWVQVRNSTDRFDILQEVLLAVEAAGATPQLEWICGLWQSFNTIILWRHRFSDS
jgi:hypothetical protein